MLEADSASLGTPGAGSRGLPDRLRNWSGRMGGSLTAMVDNLTKGMFIWFDLPATQTLHHHQTPHVPHVVQCHASYII